MAEKSKYKRVILKLSGEALAGDKGFGIDPETVESIASQIKDVTECGLEVAIVNGGGNIWRGLSGSSKGMDRATADYMGMLAQLSILWRCRMLWRLWESQHVCKQRSKCVRLQKRIFADVPYVIWKKSV